jgi:aminobenzoyl-glutamate utilization protein B
MNNSEKIVESYRPLISGLANELWDLSEISLHEVQSQHTLKAALEEHGYQITSTNTAGVATAFIAEWSNGEGPIIGLLAEYDALPGLGNAAVPRQQPREDGKTSGHGCGHNLFGAAVIGSAVALKALMQQQQIAGTIRVYGCAAEETEGAKTYMARAGLFNDLDAALHWHPHDHASVMNERFLAINQLQIEFFGRTAHAGAAPWLGRSAVHAAELFAHGINLMREHIQPSARMHYIFNQAGEAANVVPDYAKLTVIVRDIERQRVEEMSDWIKQIAQGAALATQTRSKAFTFVGTYDLLPNNTLAQRMHQHLERIGAPEYSADELAFAHELQQNAGVAPSGFDQQVSPLPPEGAIFGASTDVGDVSYLTPTMGCTLPTMPQNIQLHTWAASAVHGTSIGIKGAIQAAKILTAMGYDLLSDAELRAQARAEFSERTKGVVYRSPLPDELTRPLGTPADILQQIQEQQL